MIDRLDYLVLTVTDAARMTDVRGLGMRSATCGAGRRALAFGRQKRNPDEVAGMPSLPRAACPAPGTAVPCLIAARPLAAVEAHPKREGFGIELSPLPRTGAAGPVPSLDLHNPDGKLMEVSEHA